ncbi:hypothetical protein OF83DRAFT_1129152 [Amylostereum chailletii]|nr:hypothetical protein OF83DRAFT_1129152 [Amylostereum chailletii]
MPSYDGLDDDVYGGASSSRYLNASSSSPRKSPSRQSISLSRHRSNVSLRGNSITPSMDDEGPNSRFSLAHELAVALLPEPSAGSKLLAEEFGIDYDEGAEGIDEEAGESPHGVVLEHQPSFADELAHDGNALSNANEDPSSFPTTPSLSAPSDLYPTFGSPDQPSPRRKPAEQDAMVILAHDLESTEKFLTHLRRLDGDATSGNPQSQAALERLASNVIRKIDETVRDREGQVRELLEYEREFRKISGEVGGSDALAALEELEGLGDLSDEPTSASTSGQGQGHGDSTARDGRRALDTLAEEASFAASTGDWEVDPDQHLRDEEEVDLYESDVTTPAKESFSIPPPPPITGPLTPAKTIPQLAHLRTHTTSLVASLTIISEHAQVNGAATTEAGRKIRALKNKLGGWRTDWDSAEQSRLKIERWEAGVVDGDTPGAGRRVDGRKVVEEHLRAFERALSEANIKTQAIMAAA